MQGLEEYKRDYWRGELIITRVKYVNAINVLTGPKGALNRNLQQNGK